MTKLAVFDLDNTLSESRTKITSDMAALLQKLLNKMEVAIITGGKLERLNIQVIEELSPSANLQKLTLLPANGTSCLQYRDGSWHELYSHVLNEEEKDEVTAAIKNILGIERAEQSAEPHIDYKGGQITYSPVGIGAPDAMKKAYDPDKSRRQKIARKLHELLPNYDIAVGGLSSIDISKKGMNKSFGVRQIMNLRSLDKSEVVFMGDSLFPGGNDEPVRSTGVTCIHVSGPKETAQEIKNMLQ